MKKYNIVGIAGLVLLIGWTAYISYSTYVVFVGSGSFAELSYFYLCKEMVEFFDIPGTWKVPLIYLGKMVPLLLAVIMIVRKGTSLQPGKSGNRR